VISAWEIAIRAAVAGPRRALCLCLGMSLISIASDRLWSHGFIKQPIALASLAESVVSRNRV
jgi:hypothetical protein